MYLGENIRLAINGLLANKMRALLTMLGIIIGISSVITIVTVGNAITSSVTGFMNDLGGSGIQFRLDEKPDENGNEDYSRGFTSEDFFTDEMLRDYSETFGDELITYAATENVGSANLRQGKNEISATVSGINANGHRVQNIDILAGHFINDREEQGEKNVVVISKKIAETLYPNRPVSAALGKEIQILNEPFFITGVYNLELTGIMATMVGSELSKQVFIPLTTAHRIAGYNMGYWSFSVKAAPEVKDTAEFGKRSADFFNRKYYRNNPYVQVSAESMDSTIAQTNSVMGGISLGIGFIAGIALLVGGIGVMNIMLVSVTERTREIGTRKALGAKNSAIRIQFIVEAMIICGVGGVIGVVLGGIFGFIGSNLLGFPSAPDIGIVLIAVAFSMSIGIFFGYYPANKAAKLDPIEALRYE